MDHNTQTVPKPPDGRKRRRIYIINPAFQWKYTAIIVLGVMLVCIMTNTLVFGVLHQQARARLISPDVTDVWENTRVIFLGALGMASVVAVPFAFWSVFFTHRICGPIFVMQRYLRALADGRFPKRRPLRKKDEFKEVYDVLWNAIDELESQKRSDIERLDEAVNTLHAAADGESGPRKQALLDLLKRLAEWRSDAERSLSDSASGAPAVPSDDQASSPTAEQAYADASA